MSDPLLDMVRRLNALEQRIGATELKEVPRLIAARIYSTVNITLTTGVVTNITFNNNRLDTDGISNANGFTITRTGVYAFWAGGRFAANATGERVLYIQVNGATYIGIKGQMAITTGNPTDVQVVSTDYPLSVGDTVRLQGFQNSGGNLNLLSGGNYSIEFGMHMVGIQ